MRSSWRAPKPATKPGQHGPLYLYEFEYADRDDHNVARFTARAWRYSLEHLADAFADGPDADGWALLNAKRVGENGSTLGSPVHTFARAS